MPKKSMGGVDANGRVHHFHGKKQQGRYDAASQVLESCGSCGPDDPRTWANEAHARGAGGSSQGYRASHKKYKTNRKSSTGIFGSIPRTEILGYHLDDVVDGTELYMPVTQYIKAIKAAQEQVRHYSPWLAENTRKFFDQIETKVNNNPDCLLYNEGAELFKIMGGLAGLCLKIMGKEDTIEEAYRTTMIKPSEYYRLNRQGTAFSTHLTE